MSINFAYIGIYRIDFVSRIEKGLEDSVPILGRVPGDSDNCPDASVNKILDQYSHISRQDTTTLHTDTLILKRINGWSLIIGSINEGQ